MGYGFYEEGFGASEFEADSVKGLPVYREVTECALRAHATAGAWLRRGRPDKARRVYRHAAAHCRILGVLPWALNVCTRKGAELSAADAAYWTRELNKRLRGDLAPEYIREPGRWGAWPQEAADRMAGRAGVRDRTLWRVA